MSLRTWAAGLAAAFVAGAAVAADDGWPALTRADVEAAYALIRDNHPAAAKEMGDEAFRRNLEAGHALALERAGKVDSIEGYTATMAGFARAFQDKHVWSRPLYNPASVDWAGLLTVRRPAGVIVAEDEPAAGAASLVGWRVVGCDGRGIDAIGEEQIGGFRAVWAVEAQRAQYAPFLFENEGNPFVKRASVCEFEKDGARRTETLAWRRIGRDDFYARARKVLKFGAPGWGVREIPGGWWISLQSLEDKAIPVVEAVRARAEAMRGSSLVVLDMRRNGGGNSSYGDQIAEALLGKAYIQARTGSGSGDCGLVWRVSPDNIGTMETYRARFGPQQGPEYVAEMDRLIGRAKSAQAKGEPFTGPVACKAGAAPPRAGGPAWPIKARLVLVTDSLCFSSCLEVTDLFRRLGALHVGQTTDAATRYFEVREIKLPSGLSMFSTLQAASLGSPPQVGPFAPEIPYPGDLSDTAALETWVRATAGR